MRTEHSKANVRKNMLWEDLNVYLAFQWFGPKYESVKNNKPVITQFTAPLDPVLREINPVQDFESCFFTGHLNIILQSMPLFSQWFPSFRLPHQNRVCFPSIPQRCNMATHLITLHLIFLIILDEV